MADTFDTFQTTLTADVADAGTFTVGYPALRGAGSYTGGFDHVVSTTPYGDLKATLGKALFAFGASLVTITNKSGVTLKAGTRVSIQLDRVGRNSEDRGLASPSRMAQTPLVKVNLGAPATAAAAAVCASQSVAAAASAVLNGSLLAGGRIIFDVPRNIVAAWTTTSVLTITGKDEFGATVVETSASGASHTGKKAFKEITAISSSASITSMTAGTGTVLGLPVFLAGTGDVLREYQDGAAPTAGTIAAGITGTQSGTTGDVRGTYVPNAAPDGAKSYQLAMLAGDPAFKGSAQFAG